jgi:hypothetical protein
VGILLVMSNCRSEICAPWIRECGVYHKALEKIPLCISIMEGTKAVHINP